MKITKNGWGIYFVSPEHMDLIKDYVFAKGAQNHLYTPEKTVSIAIESFLSTNGYKVHVDEIRMRRDLNIAREKPITLDALKKEFRDAALYIMQHRDISEKEAIAWVLNHPKEVEAFV